MLVEGSPIKFPVRYENPTTGVGIWFEHGGSPPGSNDSRLGSIGGTPPYSLPDNPKPPNMPYRQRPGSVSGPYIRGLSSPPPALQVGQGIQPSSSVQEMQKIRGDTLEDVLKGNKGSMSMKSLWPSVKGTGMFSDVNQVVFTALKDAENRFKVSSKKISLAFGQK